MPCGTEAYSASPSHQLIRSVISQVLSPEQYHIVIFGTFGIVPAELEGMYPYAHYQYMPGKCREKKILKDFLRIETVRVAGYLVKTRHFHRYQIAYCIGLFREALLRGSEEAGIPFDMILPSRDRINRVVEEGDCVFEEASLSMDEYPGELFRVPDASGRRAGTFCNRFLMASGGFFAVSWGVILFFRLLQFHPENVRGFSPVTRV